MHRLRATVAAALVLAVAGCGGSPQKDIESVQSLATEGALLAQQSEKGDVTQVFVRVHGRYLEQATSKLASSLRAEGELRAARVADAVASDLERLRHGGDVATDLERLAKRAGELAQ